ncbi:hypothetical protein F4561_004873 [Lipingzhangella halophila]|uniref:Uncharacterized protein n=1 Tax=Lipingzhangella halophila TaxID=1783352 RepID=A0A7W7RL86_9ACTN|nr:hypothetical protein [Lipingzhangella halophila]
MEKEKEKAWADAAVGRIEGVRSVVLGAEDVRTVRFDVDPLPSGVQHRRPYR